MKYMGMGEEKEMGAAKAAEEAEILCVRLTKEGNMIYVVGDGPVRTKDIERNLKAYEKKKRKRMVIGLVKGCSCRAK